MAGGVTSLGHAVATGVSDLWREEGRVVVGSGGRYIDEIVNVNVIVRPRRASWKLRRTNQHDSSRTSINKSSTPHSSYTGIGIWLNRILVRS